jgi:hypothetical protein
MLLWHHDTSPAAQIKVKEQMLRYDLCNVTKTSGSWGHQNLAIEHV